MNELDGRRLDGKVEKYIYYLINYGHETASMWVQGNIEVDEVPEFKEKLQKKLKKHGFRE